MAQQWQGVARLGPDGTLGVTRGDGSDFTAGSPVDWMIAAVGGCLQGLLELLADLIVLPDVGLEADSLSGGFDRGQHVAIQVSAKGVDGDLVRARLYRLRSGDREDRQLALAAL